MRPARERDDPRHRRMVAACLPARDIDQGAMTSDEWLSICELVADLFPPGWTPDLAVRYGMELRDESHDRVVAALDGLSGLPNSRAIRRELARRPARRFNDVIEKRHRELFPNGCPYDCEICRPVVDVVNEIS